MDLERKVEQLTELMSDLVPTVDKLVKNEIKTAKAIDTLIKDGEATRNTMNKLNLGLGEMRQSNLKMIDVLEKLAIKIDRLDEFEKRLKTLEEKVL